MLQLTFFFSQWLKTADEDDGEGEAPADIPEDQPKVRAIFMQAPKSVVYLAVFEMYSFSGTCQVQHWRRVGEGWGQLIVRTTATCYPLNCPADCSDL